MADILLIILAIFIPPLAVFLHQNACNSQVLINLVLTIVGFYVIGIIHAFWVITNYSNKTMSKFLIKLSRTYNRRFHEFRNT
ncbi:unnamed protein product [Adineta steineri]|uniref:Uncharacterized protein n=1 Tax=Adineta steineri TaxID=433720 RepID=A0A819BT37_9BILA|nr:unnamed protein product [Adineta steineri]